MPNLAEHQMRVAAVAMQISDSLDFKLDKESLILSCLFHDMGNIIKFNLNYFPKHNEPEDIDYWQKVKDSFIIKYGHNEHKASKEISKEIGLSSNIIEIIDSIDPKNIEKLAIGDDFVKKICIYADNRVTPFGVVSAEERSLEAKERYKNHPHAFGEDERSVFMENLLLIEKQIFSHSNIKSENINNNSIEKYLEKLEDFSI